MDPVNRTGGARDTNAEGTLDRMRSARMCAFADKIPPRTGPIRSCPGRSSNQTLQGHRGQLTAWRPRPSRTSGPMLRWAAAAPVPADIGGIIAAELPTRCLHVLAHRGPAALR